MFLYATHAEYSTLEEYLEFQRSVRSPTLQRSSPNYDSILTPRPLVDDPESPCEDINPPFVDEPSPMIYVTTPRDVSMTSTAPGFAQQPWTAPRRASEKLNSALGSGESVLTAQIEQYQVRNPATTSVEAHRRRSRKEANISITSFTSEEASDVPHVSKLTLHTSPSDRTLNVLPPLRPTLPALYTNNASSMLATQREDSFVTSPTLAKYAIAPSHGHPSQTLPKLQHHQTPETTSSHSPVFTQSLPSLVTALSSATDSNGTPYIDVSVVMNRPSPSHHSQYALSATSCSQPTPTAAMSPPRLSSNPSSWRTLSHNSSNSTASDYNSGAGSNNGSTPATRPSPSRSVSTPHSQYPASEDDSNPDTDFHMTFSEDANYHASKTAQGYLCSFPGCTAAPFQTQYLLNSHTNVHSNQRPHFCPQEGCPRGPGGQGFKRKNEMIRHGLVHQSPGYVCPFCPDQQHKYPRPDNLQRHVRVHHVDRDRDDPMLRDVLAQRPEGGNRGRRRRLGA